MKSETMENNTHAFALRDTLNEISNACPDVKNILLFKENGDVINTEESLKETGENIVNSLLEVLGEAACLGGIQNINFSGANGIVNVSRMNEYYLVMVVRKEADLAYLTTLTNMLVPTVLKVLKRIDPTLETTLNEPKNEPTETPSNRMNDQTAESIEIPKQSEQHSARARLPEVSQANTKKILPEPQVNQFIVEHIGGIFASPDVARIDSNTLSHWKDLYEDQKIEEVNIESFGGKSTRCKIKAIRDTKSEGKGIIQIPEKIRQVLEIKKGELVRVKPVIE
jgi:hypothetical protein